jgi:hypothetical protein
MFLFFLKEERWFAFAKKWKRKYQKKALQMYFHSNGFGLLLFPLKNSVTI